MDAVPEAAGGFAAEAPGQHIPVKFSEQAEAQCETRESELPGLRKLIEQIIAQDPRPAYFADREEEEEQRFGMRLYDFDLQWQIRDGCAEVLELRSLTDESRE